MMNNCHQLVHFSFKLLLNLYTDGTVKIFSFSKTFPALFFVFSLQSGNTLKENFIFMDNEKKEFQSIAFQLFKISISQNISLNLIRESS